MGKLGRRVRARRCSRRRTFRCRQGPARRFREYLIMDRLKDKIILVTGAAGAIGAATSVAIVDEGGQAVTSDIAGRQGTDHVLDVTSEKDWLRVIAAIGETHDRLGGLVNAP